jgi:hypothetical protein
MADKVQRTEDMSSVHGEHLEPTTDREDISSPVGVKFASPDVDAESSSSSGVAAPAAELSDRRKPSAVQAQEDLKAFARMHMVSQSCFVLFKCIFLPQLDPNLDQKLYRRTRDLAAGEGDINEKIGIDMELSEDSPYPEVRAAVPNTDDPSIPCVSHVLVIR